MSNSYKVKFWTGPTLVKDIADAMRKAGIQVDLEGTEYVYVTSEGDSFDGAAWNVLADLKREHGYDFGLSGRRV